MIQTKDIPFIRGNYAIGREVECTKQLSSERSMRVKATIIGKYPHFALLLDETGSKLCIQWIDFYLKGIK